MPKYWGISLGASGRYVEPARRGGYIALGWELGDLSWLKESREDRNKIRNRFDAAYRKVYPGSTIKVGKGAGQVWNFILEMNEGDIVLVRDPVQRIVHIAGVTGGYVHEKSPDDGCPYRDRRSVSWFKSISRDDMSQRLKDSMGSLLTIFNVGRHSVEIEGLLTGTTPPKSITIKPSTTIRKGIIQRLLDLSGGEFEEFINNLLSTMGFETIRTVLVGDKGVDVIGTLIVEGVATIDLKVQVKRYRHGSIGIGEILKIRGTLGADDHGAFITTSRYTKQAQEEAQETSKKPIALIDSDMLVDLVLKHFDDLDTKYQAVLGLRRKEVPLEERFELLG